MSIKITIIEGDSSDLLPILVLLAKGGRTPASPFASPFSEGFRVGTLEDFLQYLGETGAREEPDGEGEPEGEEPFEGFNRVAKEIQELRRRARPARPTGAEGDDTAPPAPPAPPEGPQGSEGEPEADDGIPAPDDR